MRGFFYTQSLHSTVTLLGRNLRPAQQRRKNGSQRMRLEELPEHFRGIHGV